MFIRAFTGSIIMPLKGERTVEMLNLQYVGDPTKYPVIFRRISDHVVQVTGKIPIKLSGFTLSRLVPDDWKPDLFLFVIGGISYMLVEVAYKGKTHWTMLIAGGICFLLIGAINEVFRGKRH